MQNAPTYNLSSNIVQNQLTNVIDYNHEPLDSKESQEADVKQLEKTNRKKKKRNKSPKMEENSAFQVNTKVNTKPFNVLVIFRRNV